MRLSNDRRGTGTRPSPPAGELVRLDETNTQLIPETRTPLPVRPGEPARYGFEYRRGGAARLFLAFEPLTNRRRTWARPHKAAVDFAEVVRELADRFSRAVSIRLALARNSGRFPVAAIDERARSGGVWSREQCEVGG